MVFTIKFSALNTTTEQTHKIETKNFSGLWEGGLNGRVAAHATKLKKNLEKDEVIVTHVMDIKLDTEEIGEFDDPIQAYVDERANGVKGATADLFPSHNDKPAPKVAVDMEEELEVADEDPEELTEKKKEKFDWKKFAAKDKGEDDKEDLKEAKTKYEVLVGNIGIVYSGSSKSDAMKDYNEYVRQSKTNKGRAGNEDVVLMVDGEPSKEYIPLDKE